MGNIVMDSTNNSNLFIKTSDEHTAELLRKAGFQEIAKEGNRWVFINESGKLDFSKNDLNVNFDSKLMF